VNARFCDELPFAFGWIAESPGYMQRASHALVADGGVWLVDPVDVDGLEARIFAAGEPAGVIQLLDRHGRDCAALAARYGVAHHRAPVADLPGAPFDIRSCVDLPGWRESALWWSERRTLVVADALGTAPYFLAAGEQLGVHPLLRLLPPRSLADLEPQHVLCGHGEGVHGPEASAAFGTALGTSRRRIPSWLLTLARRTLRSRGA
jgi:hypothetical protein